MRRHLGILILLLPAAAQAQTADVVFGGWSWRPREVGSRPAGLGGAYVAIADGVRTAQVNPAGLTLIPHLEVSAGTAALWAGFGHRLEHTKPAPPVRPTEAAVPVPCAPPRKPRPWAIAAYAEQPFTQASEVDVVRGPGLGERGRLEATAEEVGASVAKGVTPWLDLGLTVAWRQLRMDGGTVLADADGTEEGRVLVAGLANKARAIVGALAAFGPRWAPTAVRIGVAYQQDLLPWRVERTVTDVTRGAVIAGPASIDIEEPPVLSAGLAWRLSDAWLLAGQLDYVWYDRVTGAMRDAGAPEGFVLDAQFEPRAAVEMTRPSPLGGYYKVRLGVRRETSGRVAYEGEDTALRQAFRGVPAAFRASGGVSLLAEFYARAFRLDVDLSQVVIEPRSTISAAGTRRFSIALTGRL